MPAQVDVEAAVKTALRRFYDASRIQASPLAQLVPEWHGESEPVAIVRGLLRDGIAQLQPDASVPYGRPEWMAHEVLTQRYLHLKAAEAVCAELGLGRSSYYRYHQQAIDALVAWIQIQAERLEAQSAPVSGVDVATPAGEVERLVTSSRVEPVDLVRLLEDVAALLQPLLDQQACELRIVCPGMPPMVMASRALLRQALVSLLSAALRVGVGPEISMALERVGAHAVIGLRAGIDRVRVDGVAMTVQDLEQASGVPMARALFRAYGGDTALAYGHGATEMVCRLPLTEAGRILIMDDSQDGARLMMTYLSESQYVVDWVQTEDALDVALAEHPPDVILLDILMPEADGWSILQRLKARPETAPIPVLICSVLAQPELALALGAYAVINKPVDEHTLLERIIDAIAARDAD